MTRTSVTFPQCLHPLTLKEIDLRAITVGIDAFYLGGIICKDRFYTGD